MKNILICLISAVIIILTFITPNILFKIEDMQSYRRVYSKTKIESKIDVQAQKIHLVKTIHSIEDGYLNLKVNNMYGVSKLIESEEMDALLTKCFLEIQSLKDNNVIQKTIINNSRKINRYESQERVYNDAKKEYTITQIYLNIENQERINIEIEGKTGKILLYSSSIKEIEGIEEEKILKNYIEYLGLSIIDDWEYTNNMLVSEKAKLSAILAYYDEAFYLSIHSSNNINIYKN